jgi:uncharacterized protein DUF5994
MTRGPARVSSRWDAIRRLRTPRFQVKSTAHGSGYVDGAWWPRSDDLMTELPGLIAVMPVRQGTICHVLYNLAEWRPSSTELITSGCVVQLGGYRRRPPNTVEVVDSKGNKLVLLVVPFHFDPDQAHAVVMEAAAPDNVSSVDALLMISVEDRESRTKRDAARERWIRKVESTGRKVGTPDPAAGLPGVAARPDHN